MSLALDVLLRYEVIPVDRHEDDKRPGPATLAEAALVARAQTGDFAAFEEMVRRYRNDVFALSYHFVRDREEAWDISQEVFFKAHRALNRFRGESSFKTWLLRITANHCKDHFKKRRLDTVAFDEDIRLDAAPSPALGPSKALEAREIGEAIHTAIDGLPAKHRTAFVLREFEGLSYDDMARVMHCSLGTVMSRLHHARRKLQNSLVRMGVVEDISHG